MVNTQPHAQVKDYQGYRGLPPLLGLHTMEEAAQQGLSIDASVLRLKTHCWLLRRLHGVFVFRLNAEPIYELKMAFSLHLHICAEYVGLLQTRVREMREPPYGLEDSPSAALDLLMDEIKAAPDTAGLLLGIYEHAVPALLEGVEAHLGQTNKLFDHPSYRILRLLQIEMADVLDYGRKAIACLISPEDRTHYAAWSETLSACVAAARVTGEQPSETAALSISPIYSAQPMAFDPIPQRDERFRDLFNQGVNAESFLFDPKKDTLAKTLMLAFKRMREIDVPEFMASILAETKGKPWAYYRDLSRQLWDEARHAMMGEVGLVAAGVDWTQIPLTHNTSLGMNTKLTALERHAVLLTIEQGLMSRKNGKRTEWEVAIASASPLSTLIQDYDWADEIVHARIGREWLVPEFGTLAKMLEFGDAAWIKITSDWQRQKDEGLTEHANWWPPIYLKACEHWGIEPGAAELAYNLTYAGKRADLKEISV